jgi:hypothetical protein
LLEESLDDRQPIVLVVDTVLWREAEAMRLAPKEPSAEGVEGPDPQSDRIPLEQHRNPTLHLPRRAVGEGNGENSVGAHALSLDQMRDARREHSGLPRSRTREHEEWPGTVLHRKSLRGVQLQLTHAGLSP